MENKSEIKLSELDAKILKGLILTREWPVQLMPNVLDILAKIEAQIVVVPKEESPHE
jgi:hypothetical protein